MAIILRNELFSVLKREKFLVNGTNSTCPIDRSYSSHTWLYFVSIAIELFPVFEWRATNFSNWFDFHGKFYAFDLILSKFITQRYICLVPFMDIILLFSIFLETFFNSLHCCMMCIEK